MTPSTWDNRQRPTVVWFRIIHIIIIMLFNWYGNNIRQRDICFCCVVRQFRKNQSIISKMLFRTITIAFMHTDSAIILHSNVLYSFLDVNGSTLQNIFFCCHHLDLSLPIPTTTMSGNGVSPALKSANTFIASFSYIDTMIGTVKEQIVFRLFNKIDAFVFFAVFLLCFCCVFAVFLLCFCGVLLLAVFCCLIRNTHAISLITSFISAV